MTEKKGSISNASVEVKSAPYEIKEIEIEKGIKKPQTIESGFFSHIAYEENERLVGVRSQIAKGHEPAQFDV